MIVIGLTGLARAGKDSVADILVRDYGFEKKSFAAPLKKMLRTLDPFIGAHTRNIFEHHDDELPVASFPAGTRLSVALQSDTEDAIKTNYPEYRRLLQVLGTDCIRAIDEQFWVKAALKDLAETGMNDGRYVFTDCRFPNEAESITNGLDATGYFYGYPGSVWQVTRPGIELAEGAHVSEQHVGNMGETTTIANDGTLEDLAAKVALALTTEGTV